MSVLIAHASQSENQSKNGVKGDQTGKEVCIRTWYSKPWKTLIRFKDSKKAEKVAVCMENAAKNDNIGYSQATRNTLLNEARKHNYDVSKVNVPCNCDCSSLVSVACMFAGIPESSLTLRGNCATTSTLTQCLKNTGEVDVYTSLPYLAKTDKLQRGDILLHSGSHVVVVVQTDAHKKTAEEVAIEIIKGKGNWGNGAERRIKLIDAGYNPSVIQGIINTLLKEQKPLDNERLIWYYLSRKLGNAYAVAGLMGNLKAESNLNPKNLQNSCEKRLGMTDETYTVAVDNGAYSNFASDKAGYGLAQWTSSGRKEALLNFKAGRSIGDIEMQLDFLWHELNTSFKSTLIVLKAATSVKEASDIVLTKFERPKDQSDSVKEYRAKLGVQIYQKFIK